jgi:hypothetical protein
MDIRLPASQPVSNATTYGNAIDCTIGEEIVYLQDAVHENQCCEAPSKPAALLLHPAAGVGLIQLARKAATVGG